MRQSLVLTLALTLFSITTLRAQVVPPAGSNLGSVSGGDFKQAHLLIEKRCTACHTDQRITDALLSGKDMKQIQTRMELKGLSLTADEKSVLGIFWQQTPLKKKK